MSYEFTSIISFCIGAPGKIHSPSSRLYSNGLFEFNHSRQNGVVSLHKNIRDYLAGLEVAGFRKEKGIPRP